MNVVWIVNEWLCMRECGCAWLSAPLFIIVLDYEVKDRVDLVLNQGLGLRIRDESEM